MQLRNTKGFTLVEIMIVVVIIGLLAAMAIPAFNRVRREARETTMVNDARQLGSAAQQYFLTSGKTAVTITYASTTGVISADLAPWVNKIGTGYTLPDSTIESGSTASFSLQIGGAFDGTACTFSDEGKR